ncbi:MAG TPA: hypothetical protein VNG51_11665 [Ktedonobacteraceae bacterium]|nr:hypothetical protein [Ktedonobacteraceae bacterium]
MKKCLVSFAVLFLIFVSAFHAVTGLEVSGASNLPNTPGIAITSASTPNTSSFASFNDSFTQCLGTDGNYYWGALFQTFAPVVFTPCHSQMYSDFDFLSKHHIKTVRLWPVLSTFAYGNTTQTWSSNFNSSIANLDSTLNRLAQDKIKAYITLMSTPDCGDPPEIGANLGYYFNPSLINNPTTQDQFISALKAFVARYKNNPAIYGYDLVNEMSLVIANPPTKNSHGYCNLPYDTADFTKTYALLARMYTTAKSVDTVHNFTYSFAQLYPASSPMVTNLSNDVDFYDFHAYSNDPAAFYKNFSSYNKPVVHGEVGVYGTQYDKNGNNCQGTGPNIYRNLLPAMPPECQAIWLANAQAFVKQAKMHNIQALFFELWPSLKMYGVRLYNGHNVFTGYQLTSGGKYIFSLAGS